MKFELFEIAQGGIATIALVFLAAAALALAAAVYAFLRHGLQRFGALRRPAKARNRTANARAEELT